jgi:hypothetical protein
MTDIALAGYAIIVIAILLIIWYFTSNNTSKFSNADVERSQQLFRDSNGAITFSAFKTHIADSDIVDYSKMKSMYNSLTRV